MVSLHIDTVDVHGYKWFSKATKYYYVIYQNVKENCDLS